MIGRKRLDNLQSCVESVLTEGVEGDFIETGVWRGGSCIFMRAILAAHGVHDRRVFVADSFAGLPEPDGDKYPEDKGDTHHIHDRLAISREQVAANFEKYGLLDDQVVFLKGWFKDTLPNAPIEKLAVLRLDGDMYESTMDALESLYPKLSPGGYCIIDDYSLPGCEKAVADYRARHGIEDEIQTIDWTGSYWQKS
jgi:O-methyltransferase